MTMQNKHVLIIWMSITGCLIVALSVWAIFFVEKIEYQIPIFGIVGIIITAITSVITVTINSEAPRGKPRGIFNAALTRAA